MTEVTEEAIGPAPKTIPRPSPEALTMLLPRGGTCTKEEPLSSVERWPRKGPAAARRLPAELSMYELGVRWRLALLAIVAFIPWALAVLRLVPAVLLLEKTEKSFESF